MLSVFLAFAVWAINTRADQAVLTDGLQNGWQNWSWTQIGTVPSPVHSGASAWSVAADAWEAAYFHHDAANASLYTNLTFWIHGGASGGQLLLVQGVSAGEARSYVEIPALAANSWRQVTVSLEQLGVAGDAQFDGFWIQDRSGRTQPTFFLDDITLVAGGSSPGPATNSITRVVVDASQDRRVISPLIYGVAFASSGQIEALNVPLNRSGGNAESRYNWELNAHNRGFDWYFQSIADASSTPGAETDSFIQNTRAAGAEPMITVPLLGWVPKLGPNRGKLASFSIAKYGAQTDRDAQWFPDAGNGISAANNQPITWNDPTDANQAATPAFQQNWIRHLTNRWGASERGGVRYYFMDNEPSLWHSTHRDVFKEGLTMREWRDRVIEYGTKVREVDLNAVILGPEEWGWSGYFYSGADQKWLQENNYAPNPPDRAANGGIDYLPWFLDQMRRHEQQTNRRLLDVFTVHFYPQGGEYSPTVTTAMQQRRNRSTRALWDPAYTDQTWISDRVRLIPRLKEWVSQYYPGTPVGITEYSWGADEHINGATAQADILGIFGREGLDLANRWVVPATGSPAFKAIQMYRNYDGQKSTFGETSISASAPNPDQLATFAAIRNDGAVTIMAINKTNSASPLVLTLSSIEHRGFANAWQLTSANQIVKLADTSIAGATLSNTLPAQSITLFVVPRPEVPDEFGFFIRRSDSGRIAINIVNATSGARLEKSSDLVAWSLVQAITNSNTTLELPVSGREFFRVAAP